MKTVIYNSRGWYSDYSKLTILNLPIKPQVTDSAMGCLCFWLPRAFISAFVWADQGKGPILGVLEGPGRGLSWL